MQTGERELWLYLSFLVIVAIASGLAGYFRECGVRNEYMQIHVLEKVNRQAKLDADYELRRQLNPPSKNSGRKVFSERNYDCLISVPAIWKDLIEFLCDPFDGTDVM